MSFLRVGGSWNRRAPSAGPRLEAMSMKYPVSSSTPLRRFRCVIRRVAFIEKRKFSGTRSAQETTTSGFGTR